MEKFRQDHHYVVQVFLGGDIALSTRHIEGALPIAHGEYDALWSALGAVSRLGYRKAEDVHGYAGHVLLVPGVPEAESPEAAYEALILFERALARQLEAA